jgi:hypothetical protein
MNCIAFASGEHVSAVWLRCLEAWLANHPEYARQIVHTISGPSMSRARNLTIRTVLADPSVDRVVMMDTDIAFQVDDLQRLLDHDLDVVTGLYVSSEGRKMIGHWDDGTVQWPKPHVDLGSDLMQVDAAGLGFVAIRREVFEKVGTGGWFDIIGTLGEDVSFWRRVAAAGYEIWADPSIKVGHIKQQVLMP